MILIGWFKVDDQLAFHSKVVMAGNSAMGLWVRAGAWASAQLTDGKVPKHMAKAMANQEDADALVMCGLWLDEGDDYRFHDWDVFQPSAAEEKLRREELSRKRSEAGKKGAEAKWAKERADGKHGKPDGTSLTGAQQPDDKGMAPSRPVPSLLKDSATDALPGFGDWWDAYPKKVGKQAALKAYKKALKATDAKTLRDALQGYVRTTKHTERRFIANPATWLNEGRWDDELPDAKEVFDPWTA